MTATRAQVATVCRLLNAEDAAYVVVGGVALQLWGTTRATRDIDILIEPSLPNARRVLDALARLPFGVAGELRPEDVVARGVTIVGDTPQVDVLTRAWKLQWATAEQHLVVFPLDGVAIPVASLDDLMRSKQTGRPQDTADLLLLEELKRLRGPA